MRTTEDFPVRPLATEFVRCPFCRADLCWQRVWLGFNGTCAHCHYLWTWRGADLVTGAWQGWVA